MAFKLNPLVATLTAVMALSAVSASAVTLRIGNQGDALSMDPHSLNESLQLTVVENVYESLVTRDANYKLAPLLATSWKQTAPTVWRFNLRKGVKFHDGTPFTADDVIFSYERAKGEGSDMKSYVGQFKEIKKIDDHTVELQTKGVDTVMPSLLNRPAFGPYLQLIGANRAYEPPALAIIAFAITWASIGILQFLSRFNKTAPAKP